MLSTDQIEGLVAPVMERFGVPGLSVAIVRDGESAALGFGVGDTVGRRPVDADTTFQIASCGKAYTATAAATLVDAGALGWDDPVRQHLPEFRMHDECLSRLATVRDLLSMRLGYAARGPLNFGANPELGLAAVFDRLRHMEVIAGFRELFTYLNPAYALVAEIISRRTGKAYGDYLQEAVIARLGQSRTFSQVGEFLPTRPHALPHVRLDGAGPTPIGALCGGRQGEGCIYSTANDAVRWLRLHLGHEDHEGRSIVSEASMREMHRPHVLGPASPLLGNHFVSYGFGWQLRDTPHGRIALHEGVEFGVAAFTLLAPAHRAGVAIYANLSGGQPVKTLAYALIDALAGRPARDWGGVFRTLAANETAATDERHRDQITANRQPLAPIKALVGVYHQPAHGLIDVTDEAGGLEVSFRDSRAYGAVLEHAGDNLFSGRFRYEGMRALARPASLRFFRDQEGAALAMADLGVARKVG